MERCMVKTLFRGRVPSLFVAITIALSACAYDASYGDCAVHCTTDSGCPDGLTCGPEGLCRAAEAEACTLPNDGMGGTITHVNGRTIHTFDVSWSGSTFLPPAGLSSVELLVVGGGGGGGSTRGGGGGGAGGIIHDLSYVIDQSAYIVIVGYGGPSAINGGNSSFGSITTIGGGAGRPCAAPNGGSGGGADHDTNHGAAGTGIVAQGNAGGMIGSSNLTNMTFTGAGGGGAGGQGVVGQSSSGGAGGPGLAFTISGAKVYYGAGGGGGGQDQGAINGLSPGAGGMGGGGEGGLNSAGKDAVNGTGGGGGGGGGGDPNDTFYNGGRGGDGVVIVSYKTKW